MNPPPEKPTSHAHEPNRRPCPYCGTLLRRSAEQCTRCRLPQDEATKKRVQTLTGSWYVYDPHNPSGPGVSWAKFRRLIGQGKVHTTSVVRGPATGGLWRFASQTPGVAGRLGLCHACGAEAARTDTNCAACGVDLETDIAHEPASLSVSDAEPEVVKQEMDHLAAVLTPEADLDILAIGAHRRARTSSVGAGPMVALVIAGLITAGSVIAALYFWAQTHHKQAPWGLGGEPGDVVDDDRIDQPPTRPAGGTAPGNGGGERSVSPLNGSGSAPSRGGSGSTPSPTGSSSAVPHPGPTGAASTSSAGTGGSAAPPAAPPAPTSNEAALAQQLYRAALADEADGMYEAAQQKLLDLVKNHPQSHWPHGAGDALARIRQHLAEKNRGSGFFGLPGPK